jgi:hypothetical protein
MGRETSVFSAGRSSFNWICLNFYTTLNTVMETVPIFSFNSVVVRDRQTLDRWQHHTVVIGALALSWNNVFVCSHVAFEVTL